MNESFRFVLLRMRLALLLVALTGCEAARQQVNVPFDTPFGTEQAIDVPIKGPPLPPYVVDAIGDVFYEQWVVRRARSAGKLVSEAEVTDHPTYAVFEDIRIAALRSRYSSSAKELEERGRWRLAIIKDDDVENAFGVPGGGVVLYTGMLGPANTAGKLSAVLGHEATHVLARHAATRFSADVVSALQGAGLTAGTLDIDELEPEVVASVMAGLGMGVLVGTDLPFAREMEFEADDEGLRMASDAGYDPTEGKEVWKAIDDSDTAEYLSAHPSTEDRLSALEAHMDEFVSIYEQAAVKHDAKASVPVPQR